MCRAEREYCTWLIQGLSGMARLHDARTRFCRLLGKKTKEIGAFSPPSWWRVPECPGSKRNGTAPRPKMAESDNFRKFSSCILSLYAVHGSPLSKPFPLRSRFFHLVSRPINVGAINRPIKSQFVKYWRSVFSELRAIMRSMPTIFYKSRQSNNYICELSYRNKLAGRMA